MYRLSVDTVGPFPPSTEGFQYILVITDNFTRFVEIFPLVSTTAEEAAKNLLNHIGRYGWPMEHMSDQGSQFVNSLITELLQMVGSEHVLATPYSKEESGLVERANKEVLTKLQKVLFDLNKVPQWPEYLPFVQRILNASVHSSIGVAPAQLLFGNALQLDRNVLIPFHQEGNQDTTNNAAEHQLSPYVDKMLKMQASIIHTAMKHQLIKDQRHHLSRQVGNPTEYAIGEYVLVQYPDGRMGRKPLTKFHPPWRGPMRIVNAVGSKYTVENLNTGKYEDYHVSMLKPFFYDPNLTNPEEVAMRDMNLHVVEAVLNHRGNLRYKKEEVSFEVKWIGIEDTTWEPWKELRDNIKMHDYLRSKGLGSFIPREHRTGGRNP